VLSDRRAPSCWEKRQDRKRVSASRGAHRLRRARRAFSCQY
jgi:hypothetical protein